jgi:serine/threonine protein kinase
MTTTTAKPDQVSVQSICNLLARTKLVPGDQVRGLYQRWAAEAKESANAVPRFCQWLVANKVVTEYQADRLARGQTSHYFLNQYKLVDRIGQGRMAGVYKALHPTGAAVAAKVLPPSRAKDAEAFGRFQREARLARRLKHPNIVRSFQTGESDGLHFLIMEYLEGETLRDVLQRRGKLPITEAVRLIHQALTGLQHMHEQGMVHRDLEPGNLMLVPGWSPGKPDDTSRDTVKILDIGLGRDLFDENAAGPANQALTADGSILGKPEYMAPEQARNAHTSDIRADIYSLGCVLFHTITGRPVFMDQQPVQVMVRHATEAPPPLKQFNPAVPEGLQTILDWMLAKDRNKRYPTPERAAQALQVFLASNTAPLQSPEADPQMGPYLQWLAVNADVELVPIGTPVQAAAPAAPTPTATPLVTAEGWLDDTDLQPGIKSPTKPASNALVFGLKQRDLLMISIGGAVVAVGLLILAIIVRLLLR